MTRNEFSNFICIFKCRNIPFISLIHFFILFVFLFKFSLWFLLLSSENYFFHGCKNFFSIWFLKEIKMSNHFVWSFNCFVRYRKDKSRLREKLKLDESRYIALFVFSRSIKKLFSSDCVNIYPFSIFFSLDFARWKVWGYLVLLILWFINFNICFI